MNGFIGLSIALRKELLEAWRSKRLLVLVAILAVFGMGSPLLAKFMPEMMRMVPGGEMIAQVIPTPTIADAVAQYIKNLTQFSLILAILLGMGSVVGERERGTASMMLVKPLSRGAFLSAKFVGLALSFALSLALAAGGGYLYTWILFEPLALPGWLALNALLLLYLLVYVAFALLASTLARSTAAAAGIAIALVVLVGAIGAIPGAGDYLPGRLAAWGGQLALGAGAGSGPGSGWPAVGVSFGMVVIALAAAWLCFERTEL
ncbi:MAG: ABC transporter permease [Anaerolineae bacterium]